MPKRRRNDAETSQGADAYTRLIEEIGTARLRPGDRLTEAELADRFGISRTPVREAIRQLESDGLVVHKPRVGASVRTLGYAEINELYEMRAVLEGTAARFAARAALDIELSELATLNAEMAEAVRNVPALFEPNRQFHAIIQGAARNRFLLRAVEAVHKTLLILGPSTMEEGGRAVEAVAEHEAILAALTDHDGDAAEAAMRRHIEAAHRARLRQLRGGAAA